MKPRLAIVVILFALAQGAAGCSCCGVARLCFGPPITFGTPEGARPECTEQFQKCLPGCKSKPDRAQMEACQAVCESERKLCEQPPAK
ncbi:MAG: hypothetical protein QM820_58265 [Minicystis sp.]